MKHAGLVVFAVGFASALAAGWAGLPRVLYRTEAQPVGFSHKVHAGEKVGMACNDCHAITDAGHFGGIPKIDKCAGCHAEPVTTSADEKRLVERFVKPGREVPWGVYARQPQNVRFSHAIHQNLAKLKCEQCHGQHGTSDKLPLVRVNRISGYAHTMKMSECEQCHAEKRVGTTCQSCHK